MLFQSENITEHAVLFVVFLLVLPQREEVGASRELPNHYARWFRAFGSLVRSYRVARDLTQEDMISLGFSVRHWQMIEAGRPSTLVTLLRISEAFDIPPEKLLAGLSHHLKPSKTRKSV